MKRLNAAALILLPVISILSLWFELEHYTAHSDCGWLTIEITCIFTVVCTLIWAGRRKDGRLWTAGWLIAIALLIFVLKAAWRIPLCPECDQTTAEELGFLIHWIPLGP